MEVFRGFLDAVDSNRRWKQRIDGLPEVGKWNKAFGFETADLGQGVSAGICPARAMHQNWSLNDPFNYSRELALNRVQMRLNLPAVEVGAVIGDFKADITGHRK